MLQELFRKNLILARKIKGLSQQEVADSLKVAKNTVHTWEKSKTSLDLETIEVLAKLYDVKPSWFFEIHNPAQVSETKDIPPISQKSNDSLAEKLDNKASGDTNIERGMVQKPNMKKVELLLANLVAKQDQLLEELKKDRQKQMELLAGIFLKGESTGRLAERVKQLAQQVMYNTEHSGHIEEIGSQVKE